MTYSGFDTHPSKKFFLPKNEGDQTVQKIEAHVKKRLKIKAYFNAEKIGLVLVKLSAFIKVTGSNP